MRRRFASARWIGTFGSDEFGSVVRAVLDATNEIAVGVGDAEHAAMRRHFKTTSRYEWMFWDMLSLRALAARISLT